MKAKRAMKKVLLFPMLFPLLLITNWGAYDYIVSFPRYTGFKRIKEIFKVAWEDYWECY